MDLNYDQFNGDALIFKYNLDEYGNPISIKVDKEEKQVSVHGTIQLEYVPDEYNRVVILNEDNTQMTEVFNRDEIKPNTYYVDYNNGVVYLDKSQFGKTKIYNYYKKGLQLIGCSRIYDEHDVSGKHVVLTLQEIIDAGREALRFLLDIGDAKKVIELLESLIAEGKLTITNLENKKNECIQSINNAISQATQDKNEIVQEIQDNIQQAKDEVVNVAGNKEVIIRSSDWALNIDVYEKEISHNLNSENLHVTAKNSDTKEAVTIGYKILDKTRILLKSDEAINMSVVLSASYYHATQTISDNIAEEVVKARKGELDLKTKIDSIDNCIVKVNEQLEHIETEQKGNKQVDNKAILTIIDDDGKQGLQDRWVNLCNTLGFKISMSIITGKVGNSGYLTLDEIKNFKSSGFDIISHTVTHPHINNITSEDFRNEIVNSLEYLKVNNLSDTNAVVLSYGTAYDNVSDEQCLMLKNVARETRTCLINANSGINILPIDRYLIKRVTADNLDVSQLKLKIDEAVDRKAWLIFLTHSGDYWDSVKYAEVIKYAKEKMHIMTFTEALKICDNCVDVGEEINDTHCAISKNGNARFSNLKNSMNVKEGWNTFNKLISEYEKYQVTVEQIKASDDTLTNKGGTLQTYRGNDYFSYQLFIPSSFSVNDNNIYIRKWDESTNVWGEFSILGNSIMVKNYTLDMSLSSYNLGMSISQIKNTNDNFLSKGGMLVTFKSSDKYFSYQVYYPSLASIDNNNIFMRKWSDDTSSWKEWVSLGNSMFSKEANDESVFNNALTYYLKNMITKEIVPNSKAANAPKSGVGGILTTYRFGTSYDIYGYQEYKCYNDKTTYSRAWNQSGSAWRNWEQLY